MLRRRLVTAARRLTLAWALGASAASAAWEPAVPVELIVPAGAGGGADQMARLLQRLLAAPGMLRQPVLVINKSGGDGAEGFLHMKASAGAAHKLLIAQSNLFTTPRASGVPFGHRHLTPVAMLALDQFVLWVHADAPYLSARDFFDAVRAAPDDTFALGGTGVKQEDQLLTVALQKHLGKRLSYVAFRGGRDVLESLIAKQVTCTVNNPLEALDSWRAGRVKPLCVFRATAMPQAQKVTEERAWSDIPPCKASGVNVDYQMLRGVFLPRDVSSEHVAFYTDLLRRVRELPEWGEVVEAGALDNLFLTGSAFTEWLERADARHAAWMREGGLLPKPRPAR